LQEMIDLISEPLSYEFMRRAFLAAILAGGVASLIGTFVVLRGMAFMGDALSHAVLPGIAVAHLTRHSIYAGAFLAGLITTMGIGYLSRHRRLSEDTAIGIFFTGMFALGIVIISTMQSYSIDLVHFLFGNVLAVTSDDLWLMSGAAFLILLAFALFGRAWVIYSFDPAFAETSGLPVGLLHYGLMILISLAIVVAMQTVGVVMVLAMLVTPPATARLLAGRVPAIMVLSFIFSTLAAVLGLYSSYYMNIASGAAIVLWATIIFMPVFIFAPKVKLFVQQYHQLRQRCAGKVG